MLVVLLCILIISELQKKGYLKQTADQDRVKWQQLYSQVYTYSITDDQQGFLSRTWSLLPKCVDFCRVHSTTNALLLI
jgi:hypothetical protein